MTRFVAFAVSLLLATGAAAQDAPRRGKHLPLPALRAELDPAGGRIVDAAGREVLLRGVNVNALAEYWRYGDFPTRRRASTARPASRARGSGVSGRSRHGAGSMSSVWRLAATGRCAFRRSARFS